MNCMQWCGFFVVLPGLVSGALAVDSGPASPDRPTTAPSSAWQPIPRDGIITAPGRYFLERDIETDRDSGVVINANDVTIDLGGRAIRYTGPPHDGTLGVVAQGRTGLTIANGTVGGFWFNIHCAQSSRVRIRDIRFDDIPYIGINAAGCTDVVICDNVFENFRYDLPKAADSTYLIGINIGARDAVISNNRFLARPRGGAREVKVETVFVLFCAEVTRNCMVTKNEMSASEVLPRSYGVWLATNGQASIVDNAIRNMKYGVCLASNASGLVCFNRFDAARDNETPIETTGISALGAKEIDQIKNTFVGVTTPLALPGNSKSQPASDG
jgi:hypothetical protein